MKTFKEFTEEIRDYYSARQSKIPEQHTNDKNVESAFKDAGISHGVVTHHPHPTTPETWQSVYRVPMKHYDNARKIVSSLGLSKSHLVIGDMDK